MVPCAQPMDRLRGQAVRRERGLREPRGSLKRAHKSRVITTPKGIAHHGSVSGGTGSSREPRYRPGLDASRPISRKISSLRLRGRAASNSPTRAALPNLHLLALRLRGWSVFPLEAAMYLKQSDATASLQ